MAPPPVKGALLVLFLALATIIGNTRALPSWVIPSISDGVVTGLSGGGGTSTEDCTTEKILDGFCDSTNNNAGCGE